MRPGTSLSSYEPDRQLGLSGAPESEGAEVQVPAAKV